MFLFLGGCLELPQTGPFSTNWNASLFKGWRSFSSAPALWEGRFSFLQAFHQIRRAIQPSALKQLDGALVAGCGQLGIQGQLAQHL